MSAADGTPTADEVGAAIEVLEAIVGAINDGEFTIMIENEAWHPLTQGLDALAWCQMQPAFTRWVRKAGK